MAVSVHESAGARASRLRTGVALFLVSEACLFGSLFWTYYYLRGLTPGWPAHFPSATLPAFNTLVLLAGSGTAWVAARTVRRGSRTRLSAALLATAILGAAFLAVTFWEWGHEVFRPWTDAYGSVFFTLTGFHALHVFGGVVLMLALYARTVRHKISSRNHTTIDVGSLYWHFVDLIWILVFTTVFLIR